LASLPERVRIVWPHHRLYGAELEVHGWRCIDGEVHLRLRLSDGSIGCLPASWTTLLGTGESSTTAALFSLEAIRTLRSLVEAMDRRRAARGRRTNASARP
jgi:hypothetical protein